MIFEIFAAARLVDRSAAVSACINVSAVPPDLEIATKRVVFRSTRERYSLQENGSGLSWKVTRGPLRSWLSSAAFSAWPPRLDPPMPSTPISVVPLQKASAARRAASRSSVRAGTPSSSSDLSACASQPGRARCASFKRRVVKPDADHGAGFAGERQIERNRKGKRGHRRLQLRCAGANASCPSSFRRRRRSCAPDRTTSLRHASHRPA